MGLSKIARNALGSLAGAVVLVVAIDGYVDTIDPRAGRVTPTAVASALADAASGAAAAAPTASTEPQDPFSLIAATTPEAAKKAVKPCKACHTFEEGGPNRVGPNLHDVVGHHKGTKGDYAYSDAMRASEGPWSYENLWTFLAGPRDYIPGTKMTFKGYKDPVKRAAAIAYLRSQTPNPPPLEPPATDTPPAPGATGGDANGAADEGVNMLASPPAN